MRHCHPERYTSCSPSPLKANPWGHRPWASDSIVSTMWLQGGQRSTGWGLPGSSNSLCLWLCVRTAWSFRKSWVSPFRPRSSWSIQNFDSQTLPGVFPQNPGLKSGHCGFGILVTDTANSTPLLPKSSLLLLFAGCTLEREDLSPNSRW